jgi:hypothetical protein
VESCTAVAEHTDGRFEVITWTTMQASREPEPQAAAVQAA